MRIFNRPEISGFILALALSACVTEAQEKTVEEPAAAVNAAKGHAGYYYPPPATQETYEARSSVMPNAQRITRLGFVIGITKQQLDRPYPPRFVIFAKGDGAQKLIIVSLGSSSFKTLFQARGLLAQLTAMARLTPLFASQGGQNLLTFFDLAKFLGFVNITISDGKNWSHRVVIK